MTATLISTAFDTAWPGSTQPAPGQTFLHRHLGPSPADITAMLQQVGAGSLDELTSATLPLDIQLRKPMQLPRAGGAGEQQVLARLRAMSEKNREMRSLVGMGYHACITPAVVQRNILENPGWYTQYTPYQAEIAQGRLEALLNFQTMIGDLTGLPVANASLLDEATAAAEAMAMCKAIKGGDACRFMVSNDCHPQTIAVVRTRAEALGIEVVMIEGASHQVIESIGKMGRPHPNPLPGGEGTERESKSSSPLCGVLLQYPATDGSIRDYQSLVEKVHQQGGLVVAACDLLALTLLVPAGQWGADVAVGSTQRLGMPMGLGGPHAAFMATRNEYVRRMPGRLVGVSKDAQGKPAYRLAIQTREQHIRREKATSNICTAQVLPAIVASMYGVYHGPDGLRTIAQHIADLTTTLAKALQQEGFDVGDGPWFDTLRVKLGVGSRTTDSSSRGIDAGKVIAKAIAAGINLRDFGDGSVGISLDERSDENEVRILLDCFGVQAKSVTVQSAEYPQTLRRTSLYMTHPVFHRYHSEHELLRYIKRLESRDLSLTTSMIALGSCTMKLNAAAEMLPITWPSWAEIHPYAPADQWRGYGELFAQLEAWLGEITGLPGVSLQPNAGSQGEYAGLLVIRAWHRSRGDDDRKVCLIPVSAHGTNPASAVVAGFEVVPVGCDGDGNIDLADLEQKAIQHAPRLGALMITYPSTHGVFEEGVARACAIVHEHGGRVYMDGANMNAQVGLTSPGFIGADVCHLNLHKTFCIPHGGGGPGMGPICVKADLQPFLPVTDADIVWRSLTNTNHHQGQSPPMMVSATPYGSALILVIPWVYIALLGAEGLRTATQTAILNANYMAKKLEGHYPIVYRGKGGRVAHEFIVDCRAFETSAGVKVEDIAKRLMDYGFHAPTMSWPVGGTLMIEPTESESRAELDRFCEAMILIRDEIRAIEEGRSDRNDNPLKGAPHTAMVVTGDTWPHGYSRQQAAYPAAWLKDHKFWPYVGRIDNAHGDRHLVCSCPPMVEA